MFQEISFISNIMDLFKDDWGPDISLKDLNLFKHSISLNLHILILYNGVWTLMVQFKEFKDFGAY